ncbi:MAG: LytTR family DNA-binding domain-containing protein [Bacteroidia bacterium]
MNFTAIVVDNEPPHIIRLKQMLEKDFQDYKIIAECESVDEGVAAIKNLNPDLVFLDIEMPPKTGFDLLREFDEHNFEVIFTTSYNEYAIQAIKFSALDYLLKPFSKDDLTSSLKRFESKKQKEDTKKQFENLLANLQPQPNQQKRITLATSNGMEFYKTEEIIRCESDNSYTTFFLTEKRKVVVSKPIKDWEELLDPFNFCRVHHQHLINLLHVKKYIKGEGGIAIMSDLKEVDVSRRKKDDFLKKLANT